MSARRKLKREQLPDDVEGAEPTGHDLRTQGPSDSSDSGSDLIGAGAGVGDLELDGNSDRQGTGERTSIGNDEIADGSDILPDRIVDAQHAGLGGGLDQAEEAQLGITDEEIEELSGVDDED
jgi:hypothetical protein